MYAVIIKTPTDMRPFIDGHDYSVSYLVSLNEVFEPDIRHTIDSIFGDLQDISSDEAGLVSSYLEEITEPLQKIKSFCLSIFAIRAQFVMKMHDGSIVPNWTRTNFLIIPAVGYFKSEGENKKFHHFDPACELAVRDLHEALREGKNITTYVDSQTIQRDLKNDTPWCELCCRDEMSLNSRKETSVKSPDLKTTSKIVERAIADAEALISSTGPTSALDRIHTSLHGYLKTICSEADILVIQKEISINELFNLIRRSHPKLQDLGPHQEQTIKVVKALTTILDALNSVRNKGSMAHANENLLDNNEAFLFIDASRSILRYLDTKLKK